MISTANIHRFIRCILFIAVFFITSAHSMSAANGYFVRGIVRDSITDEVLPYASVMIGGTTSGAVTDADGIFEFTVPDGTKSLQITCMGYDKKVLPIRKGRINIYAVYLSPSTTELKEIVVKKSKYSKKNNPAVEFLNRLKTQAPKTDPLRNPYYSYDKYEKIVLGLNDFMPEEHSRMLRTFPFLAEHVDTSAVSGKPYLGVMIKEKKSRHNFRNNPSAQKEIIDGLRSEGVDEIVDGESMRVFMEDVMREIDLYQNDLTLLQNRFVSPLSRIAPDFYKFYLTDTVQMGNERCIVLSFYPHNHATFGFIGHIFVPENDTTMFIRKVEMHLPREINLNFVDNLYLSQTYKKAPDGSRLKMSDELTMEISIAGKGGGLYASRHTDYAGHSFDAIADSVFSGDGSVIERTGAGDRDSVYWEEARLSHIARGESRVGELMTRLRKVPIYYWGEKILKTVFTGYVATSNPSYFDFGPVNSILSFNSMERVRLRAGGMTTANLSPHWFGRFYVAYGFKDHRWKYKAEAEYAFNRKEYHSREFPVRSIRATSSYEIDRPGESYPFTSADNIVLSLKRMSDDRATYRRLNKIEFTYETLSNFSVNLAISNDHREAAPTMPLIDGNGHFLRTFSENKLELMLRYAPGEKFFQTRTYRIPVNLDAPAVSILQTYAPKGLFGTRYDINKTEIDVAKRWWFSAFGYLDTYAGGGHVWSSSSFLDLNIPNVNLSYIIQPRSFALMNPMEFISTSYVWWDFTYWANGALFNYIPYLKKLKLREVIGFRGYWGTLADRSNPAIHKDLLQFPAETGITKLDRGPYMEVSAGIENIFKILRVDYVWRLNYRNMPYKIDRSGLRIAVHVTF